MSESAPPLSVAELDGLVVLVRALEDALYLSGPNARKLERAIEEVVELRELLLLVYPFVAESTPAEVNGVSHERILRRLRAVLASRGLET